MSRVSIIIPCHNDGPYLTEAYTSARLQTHADLEIIVVNDGSDQPDTLRVLDKLRGQGACVLNNTGHSGVAAARNFGIAAASGHYILPLDADDKMEPTYAAKAAAVLDGNPQIGICYCRANLFGLKHGPWRLPPFSKGEILLGNMIFASAMFRREDWRAVGGYDESINHAPEDHALWLALLNLGVEVWQIPEELFHYRIRSRSRSAEMFSCEQKQTQAARAVFHARLECYQKNLEALFLQSHALYHKDQRHRKLFSYQLLRPVMLVEMRIRAWVKQIIGRA